MKFITSRILSPTETKSLQDIAQDIINKRNAESSKTVKTSSSSPKKTVVAQKQDEVCAKPKADKVNRKTVKSAKVDKVAKVAKSKKNTVAKVAKAADKVVEPKVESPVDKVAGVSPRFTFTKVAKLTDKDKQFLSSYYKQYYPADYVDALLASY